MEFNQTKTNAAKGICRDIKTDTLPVKIDQADLLNEILERESEFNRSHPCTIFIPNIRELDRICAQVKAAFESHHLDKSLVKCEKKTEDDFNYGEIILETDRALNKFVLGLQVKSCYEGRRSITEERMVEVEGLVQRADQYLEKFERKSQAKLNFKLSSDTPTSEILDQLLATHQDVVIGEIHSDISPKKALIENMSTLKKHGASLVLEHLLYDPGQKLLDSYLNSQSDKMPGRLQAYLAALDYGHKVGGRLKDKDMADKYNFTQLVIAAKRHGVRVIAIETETSYLAGTSANLHSHADQSSRYKTMNFLNKLITEHERHGKKLVHFLGSAHVNTREGVLGVAELMWGAPTIVISDSKHSKRTIETNVDLGEEDIKADIHIIEPVK
jgi:hypothetical protein